MVWGSKNDDKISIQVLTYKCFCFNVIFSKVYFDLSKTSKPMLFNFGCILKSDILSALPLSLATIIGVRVLGQQFYLKALWGLKCAVRVENQCSNWWCIKPSDFRFEGSLHKLCWIFYEENLIYHCQLYEDALGIITQQEPMGKK